MKETDVIEKINNSTQNDWIVDDETGNFTYKEDVLLRIKRKDNDFKQEFKESWATQHPDPTAYQLIYEVYYGDSFIIRKYLVSVDGGKAILPMPDLKTNTVASDDYNFAKIVSIVDRVDDYLERSKLKVN